MHSIRQAVELGSALTKFFTMGNKLRRYVKIKQSYIRGIYKNAVLLSDLQYSCKVKFQENSVKTVLDI